MIQKLIRLYEGEALSGANDQVLFVPVEFALTIQKIKVKLEETAASDVVFCLTNADSTTISGTTVTIPAGADAHTAAGLTVARSEDADIYLKLVSGAVNSTITLTLTVDDGEAGGGGVTDHGDLTGLSDDDHAQYFNQTRGDARYAQSSVVTSSLAGKQNSLGFTPENVANKNVAGGYVGLDGSAKISSTYLPSYVDDVLEYANLAALPATGETGKIYVTIDTNFEYRWTGSVYVRLVSSPGTTDEVPESGSPTNKYFTNARVLAVTLLGYAIGSNAAIVATDTILQAFGKLQGQIAAIINTLSFQAAEITDNAANISSNSSAIAANTTNIANRIPTSYLDTDGTLAANSDTKIATQKAVKTYVAANAGSAATDANIALTDITTNNVSTTKHGFAPKLPNDAIKFLDGTGGYSIPAGSGGIRPGDAMTAFYLRDDFIGGGYGGTAAKWFIFGSVSIAQQIGEANHPGIWRANSSDASQTGMTLCRQGTTGAGNVLPTEFFDVVWIARFSTLSATSTMNAGLGNSNAFSSGISIGKATGDSAFSAQCNNNGTITKTLMSVSPVQGTWYKFRIRRINSTDIGFSINDGTETIITTNIPTAALNPSIMCIGASGAAPTVLDFDYFDMSVSGLTRY